MWNPHIVVRDQRQQVMQPRCRLRTMPHSLPPPNHTPLQLPPGAEACRADWSCLPSPTTHHTSATASRC